MKCERRISGARLLQARLTINLGALSAAMTPINHQTTAIVDGILGVGNVLKAHGQLC